MPRVPVDIEIRTRSGPVVPSTRLYIFDRNTTDEVSVYDADTAGSVITQPLLSDVEGRFPDSWVEAGSYDRYSPDDTVQPTQPWEAIAGLIRVAYDIREWGTFANGSDISGILATAIDDSAVGGVGNPGKIMLPAGDDYGVDTTVNMRTGVTVEGAGMGTTVLKSGLDNVFRFFNDSFAALRNMTISGEGLIVIPVKADSGCTDITLENLELKNSAHTLLFLEQINRVYLHNLYLHECRDTASVGGVGFWAFKNCHQIVGDNIQVYDTDHAGILLDAGTGDALGVVNTQISLSNLVLKDVSKDVSGGGLMLEGTQHSTISNVVIDGAGKSGTANPAIQFSRDQADIGSDYNQISNVTIRNAWGSGIRLYASKGNQIANVNMLDIGRQGAGYYPILLGHATSTSDPCTDNSFNAIKAAPGTGQFTAGVKFGDGAGTLSRNTITNSDFGGAALRENHGSATVDDNNYVRVEAPADLYRELSRAIAILQAATTASGNKYHFIGNVANSTSVAPGAIAQHWFPMIEVKASELLIAGQTSKLRLKTIIATNNVAPAVTYTVGLYPLTIAAGAFVLGTVVTGSTAAIASPAANTLTVANSGDFTLPADGVYALGVISSGTPTASGNVSVEAQLEARSVV